MTTVAPNPALIAYTLLVLLGLSATIVTAMKGRWGWVLAGLLTSGLVCLYSATLPAEPGSLWSRWETRRRRHRAS